MSNLYNRVSAALYAQQFAIQYNKDFARSEFDCTDFVSQALLAGGWDQIEGDYNSDLAWWSSKTDGSRGTPDIMSFAVREQSYTWASADRFASFLVKSGRAYECKEAELALGDVMQMLDPSGAAHHSMIVTKVSDGKRYLSYHSKDRRDVELSTIKTILSDVRYWKIRDFIPAARVALSPGMAALLRGVKEGAGRR